MIIPTKALMEKATAKVKIPTSENKLKISTRYTTKLERLTKAMKRE